MAIRKKGVATIDLTLKFTKQFRAALIPVPGERILKKSRVRHLNNERLNGRFHHPEWAQAYVEVNPDVMYRVNGNHSSAMLAQLSPAEFPAGLTLTLTTYEIDSIEDDLANLFNMFDHPSAGRTAEDELCTGIACFSDLAKIEHRERIYPAAKGINAYNKIEARRLTVEWMKKKEKALKSASTKALPVKPQIGHLHEYRERELRAHFVREENRAFVLWFDELWTSATATMVGRKNVKFFKKDGIVAQMYGGWLQNKDAAKKFWHLMFTESHENAEHVTRTLSNDLRNLISESNKNQTEVLYAAAYKAWKTAITPSLIQMPTPPSASSEAAVM